MISFQEHQVFPAWSFYVFFLTKEFDVSWSKPAFSTECSVLSTTLSYLREKYKTRELLDYLKLLQLEIKLNCYRGVFVLLS